MLKFSDFLQKRKETILVYIGVDDMTSREKSKTKIIGYCYRGVGTFHTQEKGNYQVKAERLNDYFLEHGYPSDKIYIECKRDNPKDHLDYIETIINGLDVNDVFVVVSAKDLGDDLNTFIDVYKKLWNFKKSGKKYIGLDARFLDCSWLDIKFLQNNGFSLDVAIDVIRRTYDSALTEKNAFKMARKYLRDERKLSGEYSYTSWKGRTYITRKEVEARAYIRANSRDFGNGSMSDPEIIDNLGISRRSYYKYKKNARSELEEERKCQ